jgi:hypothetical protein
MPMRGLFAGKTKHITGATVSRASRHDIRACGGLPFGWAGPDGSGTELRGPYRYGYKGNESHADAIIFVRSRERAAVSVWFAWATSCL